MPLEGEYEPSAWDWVRDQVALVEGSGGEAGTDFLDRPVIVVTSLGVKSGKLRKNPLMRVEHDGRYAAVASVGGAPDNPNWYYNVAAHPYVDVQDGPVTQDMIAREITGEERAVWWERAVAAYPDYANYQANCERIIPVFVLEPTR
jgi:F420H(2)-dependent quinone reductase